MTAIKKCTCQHKYQDETYGYQNRVCNKTTNGYRCTVCGKDIASTVIKKKK